MLALLFPGTRARHRDGREPFQQSINNLSRMQQIANRREGLVQGLWLRRRWLYCGVMNQVRPGGGKK
jgi:hypothetical protein